MLVMWVMVRELCENVVYIIRVSDEVTLVVFVLEEDIMRLICRYVLQGGRKLRERLFLQ